ncbi:type II toxin-antitoxin system YafO family toxin [Brenneria goodwinii]|uniref:type II toxin-antitoxin system YafO family toxin n=1 Tax=Brenneria goodwinii TaxID=1109412 RepID=UPI0036EF86A3
MPLAINLSCCEKLANNGEFLPFYQEFCTYKQLSTEHSRPRNSIQKLFASISILFGRDRGNVDEDEPFHQKKEGLTHLHVREEDSIWEDKDGNPLVQWECKSNSYLIYSYFVHLGTRYYYVVDFIDHDAHANWQNQQAIQMWIDEAKQYRLGITKAAA